MKLVDLMGALTDHGLRAQLVKFSEKADYEEVVAFSVVGVLGQFEQLVDGSWQFALAGRAMNGAALEDSAKEIRKEANDLRKRANDADLNARATERAASLLGKLR